jgi:predicted RNA binding protein YcfA (HicA-like mRNA interferase family)
MFWSETDAAKILASRCIHGSRLLEEILETPSQRSRCPRRQPETCRLNEEILSHTPAFSCSSFRLAERPSGYYLRPVPRKIRQLVADLGQAGFYLAPGGKGSHRKFRHPKNAGSLILSGQDGEDARHYQERQVRNAIREVRK